MQYLRLADAQARLNNCIIQHKGQTIYIEHLEETEPRVFIAFGIDLESRKPTQISLNDNWISPPKFRLGYANVFNNKKLYVMNLSRVPARRSYLGLCSNNSSAKFFMKDDLDEITRLSWTSVFLGTGFMNAQNNEFFNLKQVEEYSKGAISNDFALNRVSLKTYQIYWEDNVIGEWTIKDHCVELYPPYAWCVETIERLFTSKGETVNVTVSA